MIYILCIILATQSGTISYYAFRYVNEICPKLVLVLCATWKCSKWCLYLIGRRGRGYATDRSYRRPSGNRGPRRPYYSYGNKGGPRQHTGCCLICLPQML